MTGIFDTAFHFPDTFLRFVVIDIEDYERERAEKKLLMKLQEAEEAVKDGEGWLDLDELKTLVEE